MYSVPPRASGTADRGGKIFGHTIWIVKPNAYKSLIFSRRQKSPPEEKHKKTARN